MATFLDLSKELARESGTLSPNAIVATNGLSGRPAKVVGWVRKAWVSIQNSRPCWNWMKAEFTSELTPGQTEYAAASFGLARFSRWIEDSDYLSPLTIWDPVIGTDDEGALRQIPYDEWFRRYCRGHQDYNKPSDWAIKSNGSIVIGQSPDAAYGVRGLYVKSPQVLDAPDDTPEMPERFHDLIVYEAHRLLMIADGALQESAWPREEYIRIRSELERDQLPQVTIG